MTNAPLLVVLVVVFAGCFHSPAKATEEAKPQKLIILSSGRRGADRGALLAVDKLRSRKLKIVVESAGSYKEDYLEEPQLAKKWGLTLVGDGVDDPAKTDCQKAHFVVAFRPARESLAWEERDTLLEQAVNCVCFASWSSAFDLHGSGPEHAAKTSPQYVNRGLTHFRAGEQYGFVSKVNPSMTSQKKAEKTGMVFWLPPWPSSNPKAPELDARWAAEQLEKELQGTLAQWEADEFVLYVIGSMPGNDDSEAHVADVLVMALDSLYGVPVVQDTEAHDRMIRIIIVSSCGGGAILAVCLMGFIASYVRRKHLAAHPREPHLLVEMPPKESLHPGQMHDEEDEEAKRQAEERERALEAKKAEVHKWKEELMRRALFNKHFNKTETPQEEAEEIRFVFDEKQGHLTLHLSTKRGDRTATFISVSAIHRFGDLDILPGEPFAIELEDGMGTLEGTLLRDGKCTKVLWGGAVYANVWRACVS